ncbi:hypothetical protein PCIT_a3391 [Pseudoalteromonas citrea]|uniref:Uncharacterized protein n=1 Tax=Pseudoalteromonas citrea TaxID=43655 RepID=A0AAD4AGV3_9GAMM|nr:hypothetical protein PCIT_a3391 [Pseudoalteromonas citrea]
MIPQSVNFDWVKCCFMLILAPKGIIQCVLFDNRHGKGVP